MPFSHLPKGGGDPGWFSFLMIVILAVWGGLINYLSRVRSAAKTFSWGELVFESAISAFAGLLIGLMAFSFDVNIYMCWALAGISGHAGGRTVFFLDKFWGDRIKQFLKVKP